MSRGLEKLNLNDSSSISVELIYSRSRKILDVLYGFNSADSKWFSNAIISHVIGVEPIELYQHFNRILSFIEVQTIQKMIREISSYQPLDYVIHQLYDGKKTIHSASLIPRPETQEMVIHAVKILELMIERRNPQGIHILELGCAGGFILSFLYEALETLLKKRKIAPNFHIFLYGSDLSSKALCLAEENLKSLKGLKEGKVISLARLKKGSWWTAWEDDQIKFDLVLANPPYISRLDSTRVVLGTWLWEPHLALFSTGEKGLDCLEEISKNAERFMKNPSSLFLEHSDDQQGDVIAYFDKAEGFCDMQGKPRWVRAQF